MKSIPYILVTCLFLLTQTSSAQTSRHRKHVLPKNLFVDQQLSGPITLKSEGLELDPIKPLQATRDTQELLLLPDQPFPKPEDGHDADIEAELIGSNGITYRSAPGLSETLSGDLKVTSRSLVFKNLPQDITYTKVRIKSSTRYPVKKIFWRCYNWGEVHH